MKRFDYHFTKMTLTYRSAKLFLHPGLYLKVWGKWYLVWKV